MGIPLAIASFAMTSIFICLLVTQKVTPANVVAAAFAILGVYTCKTIGLSGPAILVGALVGVMAALLFTWAKERGCTEFASDCELDNAASLAFHLHAGFEEANRLICFAKRL